jgi:hypothetical protein
MLTEVALSLLPFRVDLTRLARANIHILNFLYERIVMSSSDSLSWSFDADYLQACNCDYGCPCEFSAPPTPGFCEGTGTWRIKTGRCGNVPLDGLCLAFAAHWPKAIHLGGGTLTAFIDERANQEQRRALENIVLGKLGGLPFEILATTFSTVQETRFVPFEFRLAGRNSGARIGNDVAFDLEPVKNPVTGEPEFVRIEHATGFIFRGAEVVSARELSVSAGTINFQYSDKAGFVTEVHYQN